MKILLLISVVTLLGGCTMYSDPNTGQFHTVYGFGYIDPESLVPHNAKDLH